MCGRGAPGCAASITLHRALVRNAPKNDNKKRKKLKSSDPFLTIRRRLLVLSSVLQLKFAIRFERHSGQPRITVRGSATRNPEISKTSGFPVFNELLLQDTR